MMHHEVDAMRGGIATHLDALIFIGRANQNDRLDGLPGNAWRLRERLIFIRRAIVK